MENEIEITLEKNTELAEQITPILEIIRGANLDVSYMKATLEKMARDTSFKQAAAVLNPDPHTVNEQHDLLIAKNRLFGALIELCEANQEVFKVTMKFSNAKRQQNEMGKIFGV